MGPLLTQPCDQHCASDPSEVSPKVCAVDRVDVRRLRTTCCSLRGGCVVCHVHIAGAPAAAEAVNRVIAGGDESDGASDAASNSDSSSSSDEDEKERAAAREQKRKRARKERS